MHAEIPIYFGRLIFFCIMKPSLAEELKTDQLIPQSEGSAVSSSSLPVSNSSVPVSNLVPVSNSSSSPAAGVMEMPRASAPPKCQACTGCLLKEPCQECSMCLKGSTDCLRRRCKEKMRFYNEQQRLRKELARRQLAALNDSDSSDSSPGGFYPSTLQESPYLENFKEGRGCLRKNLSSLSKR